MKEPGKGFGSNSCPPGCLCGKHHMAGVVLGRKFCSSCHRWRHLIYFHVHTKDENDNPVRWQSRCETCHRIHKRITEGRRLRGFRYNQRIKRDPEKQLLIERRRHSRRMTSRRQGDPLVPLKPFARALEDVMHEFDSHYQFAAFIGVEDRQLKRMLSAIHVQRGGKIVKWLDIKLSQVDEILTKLEIPLPEVYDPDDYSWLYEDRRPKRYPKSRNHPRRKVQNVG